jgi:ADP-ribose pyrophosphatase YjhB (NUDIX family)/Uma2 family endonuclease
MPTTRYKRMTLEAFLELPPKQPALEFEDGEVRQNVSPMGEHGRLQAKFAELLNSFAEPRRLGMSFTETRTTFAGRSRVPNLCLYAWARIPRTATGRVGSRYLTPPDLAVEVISPGQTVQDLSERCRWYVANGVRIALLVDYFTEAVTRLTPAGEVVLNAMPVSFCPQCGTALERRPVFGRERPACPACEYVHFDDPKVAVGVVAERDGQILMAQRNHEPKLGEWSFPSGFVDAYENVEEAAVREAQEETGLEVRIEHLLGVYQEPGSRVIFLAYAGTAEEGEPVAGDECLDVRFFAPDALPPPAFLHDRAIMEAWRRWRGAGSGERGAGDA